MKTKKFEDFKKPIPSFIFEFAITDYDNDPDLDDVTYISYNPEPTQIIDLTLT